METFEETIRPHLDALPEDHLQALHREEADAIREGARAGCHVVAAVALLALGACGGEADDRAASPAPDAAAGTDRAAASGAAESVPGRKLAIPVPDARLTDLSGDTVRLRETLEGPALLNFWATWCKPCLDEIPDLVELHGNLRGTRARVVGIAVASGDSAEIRRFAGEHDMSYRLYHVPQSWAREHFRVLGLPVTLVVENDTIRRRLVGPHSLETFEAALRPWTDALGPAAAGT